MQRSMSMRCIPTWPQHRSIYCSIHYNGGLSIQFNSIFFQLKTKIHPSYTSKKAWPSKIEFINSTLGMWRPPAASPELINYFLLHGHAFLVEYFIPSWYNTEWIFGSPGPHRGCASGLCSPRWALFFRQIQNLVSLWCIYLTHYVR